MADLCFAACHWLFGNREADLAQRPTLGTSYRVFPSLSRHHPQKTGLTPADPRRLADKQGWTEGGALTPSTKAGAIVAWFKEHHDLGHGHSMAVFALLKGAKKEGDA